MKILFKRLRMLNFKGIQSRTVEFSDHVTVIQGRNRIGKTTIADACWWVLFGKDSNGNAKFGLKTNGPDMQPIPHLDHEVELTMTVDGTEVVLMRQLKEVWAKRRGEEETLKGNTTVSFVNGNKVNEKDYIAYIDSLCSEGLFRVLSKSEVFFGLKPDAQRELLVRMVGEKSMEEFAEEHPEFRQMISEMGMLDFDTYMSGLAYKVKEIDKAITDGDSRLQEQIRELNDLGGSREAMEEAREGVARYDGEIAAQQRKLEDTDAARNGKLAEMAADIDGCREKISAIRRKADDEVNAARMERNRELEEAAAAMDAAKADMNSYADMKKRSRKAEMDLVNSRIFAYREDAKVQAEGRQRGQDSIIRNIEMAVSGKQGEIQAAESQISSIAVQMEAYKKDAARLRDEWNRNETFRDEISTECPTCHQRLPEDRIEEIRAEADRQYDETYQRLTAKARELKATREKLEKSQSEWHLTDISLRNDMDVLKEELAKAKAVKVCTASDILSGNAVYLDLVRKYQGMIQADIAQDADLESDDRYKEMQAAVEKATQRVAAIRAELPPTADEILRRDGEYGRLCGDLASLEAERRKAVADAGQDEAAAAVRAEIARLTAERDVLVKRLGLADVIESKRKRIAELEKLLDGLRQQKADIEEKRETARSYQECMIADLERRVNALFHGIKFRMFETYLNGNIEPCCKCYIGVTEYKDGSHAERVNAGLEMIDTMSRYNGVSVPCFVDDAEGINQIYETDSQQIRLVATYEDEMQIIHQ